jgi:hypothetical protein
VLVPNNRRVILEEMAFSGIRVLKDENFQLRFPEPQQKELEYLSQVLTNALDKTPTMLGCLKGALDRYWVARITNPMDHTEAFKVHFNQAGSIEVPEKCLRA